MIEKRGAFYRYNDGLIGQGRENAKEYLRDNPDLMYEIETLIRQSYNNNAAPARLRGRRGSRRDRRGRGLITTSL